MTRKCITLFFIITVCSYLLLNGIFGEQGIISSKEMKDELEKSKEQVAQLELRIQDLEKEKESALTTDGLKDSALKLGYQTPGDQVYYFSNETKEATNIQQDTPNSSVNKSENLLKRFKTIDLIILSVVFALIISIIYFFILKRNYLIEEKKEIDSKKTRHKNKTGNIDLT